MAKIPFYLLDVRRAEYNNKQAVLLFGRTTDNQRICVIDDSYIPYFYVIPKKGANVKEKLGKIEVERDDIISKVIKAEDVKKKFYGKEVNAIRVHVPFFKDMRVIQSVIAEWEIIDGIYEVDIPYLRKYLAEKGFLVSNLLEAEAEPVNAGFKVDSFLASSITMNSEDTIKKLKTLAIDIETYNPDGVNIDMKKNPIIMMSFYGDDTADVVDGQDVSSKPFRKVITWKHFKTDLEYIEFVNSESEIIEKFVEVVDRYAPDIIVGYNTDIFDFPYIQERAKKYKIDLKIGLNNSGLRIAAGDNKRVRIPGMIHIDMLRFMKKVAGISGGHSLDNVSKKLLNKEKKDIKLADMYKVWDEGKEDIQEYCEYNLIDSELAYELCRKFLPNIIELAKIAGMTVDNVVRLGYSQIAESFLLRQAHNFGEIAPSKPDKTEIAKRFLESYKGSFVFEPLPGLYDNIVVFDFRSLYPSIVVSHNISPDTMDCECCDDDSNIAPDDKEIGHHFCKDKEGFFPLILDDLITRRTRIKEMQKEENVFLAARAENLKILANSFYGYLGFYGARWYSIESARAVTAWGRYYIKRVIDEARKSGFLVVYSDTDSIFIALGDKNEEDALKFKEEVNKWLPGLMELEYEDIYRRGIFVGAKEKSAGAKKKYALLSQYGDLKIKGFESVRVNWSPIARQVQREVIDIILKKGDATGALEYVREVVGKLQAKEIENKETVIGVTLQKEVDKYDTLALQSRRR